MASSWYYYRANQKCGPFSSSQLKQLADSGMLLPNDLVHKEGSSGWIQAGSVKGLFPGRAKDQVLSPPVLPTAYPMAQPVPTASGDEWRRHPPALPAPKPPAQGSSPGEHDSRPATVSLPPSRPADFENLYHRVLSLSIPVGVMVVIGDLIPGINVLAQISGLILLVVTSSMFLHRSWAQIQDGRARTTPSKAVGLRFVPWFALYWEFVAVKGLAEDVNAYARERCIPAKPVSESLARWYCWLNALSANLGLIPFVGEVLFIATLVLFLVQMGQVKEASMAIAEAKLSGVSGSRGSQGGPSSRGGPEVLDVVAGALKAASALANLSLHEHGQPDQDSE
jgi:hypothetical protein